MMWVSQRHGLVLWLLHGLPHWASLWSAPQCHLSLQVRVEKRPGLIHLTQKSTVQMDPLNWLYNSILFKSSCMGWIQGSEPQMATCVHWPTRPPVDLFIFPSIHPYIYPSIHPSFLPPFSKSIFPSTHLLSLLSFICLSILSLSHPSTLLLSYSLAHHLFMEHPWLNY